MDQIYNEHFVGLDVDFDGKQAGKMGYILYDWENDGSYDHIEFGMISADGLSWHKWNSLPTELPELTLFVSLNHYAQWSQNDVSKM